jgi:hypothetical protein
MFPDQLRLEEYFLGETTGWGMFRDRYGKLKQEFRVHALGEWRDGCLYLHERFIYRDDATQQDEVQESASLQISRNEVQKGTSQPEYQHKQQQERTWRITPLGDGRYTGSAEDVVGEAQGEIVGTTCSWQYKLIVPVGKREIILKFDDCLQLMPDGCLLGHAKVSKLGFHIGDVVLCFHKRPYDFFRE